MIESLTEEISALKAAMLHRVRPEKGGFRSSNSDTGLIQLGYDDARAVGDPDVIAWAKGYRLFFEEAEIKILPHEVFGCYFNNTMYARMMGIRKVDSAISGHFSVDYRLMLEVGVPGGLDYIDHWRSIVLSPANTEQDPRSPDFYTACTLVWSGFRNFLKRYQLAAESKLRSPEAQEDGYRWVARIAQTMKQLQEMPPRDLYDVITLITLYHMVIQLSVGCCSFGQPDRFLYPYYLQSVKDGATPSEIKAILSAWFIKLNEFMDVPQGFMLGGQDAQGECMANDLTLLMLEIAGDLNLTNPAMSFAWNPKVPKRFMDQIVKNYARGVMHPQLFNDLVLVPGFERIGVAHADAVKYVNCTCTEPTTSGCSNIFVVTDYLDPNRCLMKVVHGANLNSVHEAMGGDKGKVSSYMPQFVPEFATFDEFLDAFYEELTVEIDQKMQTQIRGQKQRIDTFAQPLVSLFMHDCIEKGLDLAWGSGRYNYTYPQFVGFSTLIDSLYVVKELVFKARSHTLAELGAILAANWQGQEALRQRVVQKLPKWGNDDKEIDALGQAVSQRYAQIVERYHGIFPNGSFHPGYLNFVVHGQYGKALGATPNGRLQQEALSNSFAAAQGVAREGLTAMCNSAAKIDQRRAIGSCTLNITLLQSTLQTPDQRDKFSQLVQAYFLNGGTQVQVNIFDKAMLRDAQKLPEKYPELVVKVGGFSARFIDLEPVLQNEIIRRDGFSV
jgi:formate C-acetyltransferase